MQSKMTIEYLPVKQLHEYSRNAKKHPTEQVEHIAHPANCVKRAERKAGSHGR